jgi:hypothetical protein
VPARRPATPYWEVALGHEVAASILAPMTRCGLASSLREHRTTTTLSSGPEISSTLDVARATDRLGNYSADTVSADVIAMMSASLPFADLNAIVDLSGGAPLR